jgi:serine/threonine protein kinase HipA of HipAB toxin-antitoxin module
VRLLLHVGTLYAVLRRAADRVNFLRPDHTMAGNAEDELLERSAVGFEDLEKLSVVISHSRPACARTVHVCSCC